MIKYLNGLLNEANPNSNFTKNAIHNTIKTWENINLHFSGLGKQIKVPNACPGENDNILIVWSQDSFYLECEVFGNGKREYFFRERLSGNNKSFDFLETEEETNEVYQLLNIFEVIND